MENKKKKDSEELSFEAEIQEGRGWNFSLIIRLTEEIQAL